MTRRSLHIPVLLEHVVKILSRNEKQVFLDLTFGAGGHSKALLDNNPQSIIYATDRDPRAVEIGHQLIRDYPDRLFLFQSKFSQIKQTFLGKENFFDGIVLDAGTSSMQLDDPKRGFSYRHEGPLDMRMNPNENCLKASDLINGLDESSLSRLIRLYGEDDRHRKIARTIYQWRTTFGSINDSKQLADVIQLGLGSNVKDFDRLNRPSHPATKTFQALRIVVNDELNELYNGLEQAFNLLKPSGTMVCISFHSLEDRIIKRHFQGIVLRNDEFFSNIQNENLRNQAEKHLRYKMETKKIIEADSQEVESNPKSRSAKLRYGIKIDSVHPR